MTDLTLSFVSSSWDEANVTNIMYTTGLQVEIILLLAKVSLYMRDYHQERKKVANSYKSNFVGDLIPCLRL